jgi:tryptophan synthase alpha chain
MDLTAYINERRRKRKILLMTHVIVGYPSLDVNWRMLEIMAELDVDLVELQMPFSEPVADGPAFVRANQLALEGGLGLDQYFEFMARATSAFPFPHLMMGYYNTAYKLGHDQFCRRVSESGGVGYILPDLPFEEYGDMFDVGRANELTPILFMTPTNTEARLQEIGKKVEGFVYVVARKGVTGSRTALAPGAFQFFQRCRAATAAPLALGFGLRQGKDLRQLHGVVEIGIVGSALLEVWEQGGEKAYESFLRELISGRE